MLTLKKDMLMADGIDRGEQFVYDHSRRLIEATGPYGNRNAPRRTLQYSYGVDGQPIVADDKAYRYDVSNQHRLSSYNQRVYTYDNVLSPDKHKGLVMERRAPGNEVTRFLYHWTGRIKQSQSIRANTITTVDYEYDTEGNRFIKRTDISGIVSEIHDVSSDYRIHADGSSEVHTIEIRNGNDPVARFRFQDNHHNSGVWAPSSLFSHRLGGDLLRIAAFEGGFTKLPSLLGFAFFDTYYVIKFLPHFQSKAKFLILLYWSFAILVAFAAFVLLLLSWRKNQTSQFSLLPVYVTRVTSILALISFSAACVKTPATADDSTYLLLANGVLGAGSEGNSNILSVLGAFYYISTHNGSTDIVTNADGMAIARFAYEPFGKVNTELTDLDPDRNGVHYGESFMFTGQEFEPETGLYNYKARIYDAETGRFLQPDPVHTDQPGQDNWDRYQYVWNNPVNFTDPTGEAPCLFKAAGNYITITGTRCGSRALPSNYEKQFMLFQLLGQLIPDKTDIERLIIGYYLTKYPNPPLSEVDTSAMLHDEEFSTSRTLHENLRANAKFMGRNIGGFFTTNYYRNTFKREMDAVPDWYGDFKPVIGYINYIGTVAAELLITIISTTIFTLGFNPIVMGATIIAGNTRPGQFQTRKARYKFQGNIERMLAPRGDLNLGRIRFDTHFGTSRLNLDMSLKLPRARFNNLGNAKKWRL